MKLLVTGGTSAAGKAFLKKFGKSFNAVAPTVEQLDLTDARAADRYFNAHSFDAVLHLAGGEDENGNPQDLVMFKNLQYAALSHGVKKMLVVGDGSEYDCRRALVDVRESALGIYVPSDPKAYGKYLISTLARRDKITTVLRVFELYGTGKSTIDKIIAAGARGKKQIVIDKDRVVGGIYVDDAIKVIAAFLRGDYPKGDYNLACGDKISYLDAAKSVKRLVKRNGGDITIKVKDPEPELEYSADNSKLFSVMPIKFNTFSEGIKKVYHSLTEK